MVVFFFLFDRVLKGLNEALLSKGKHLVATGLGLLSCYIYDSYL